MSDVSIGEKSKKANQAVLSSNISIRAAAAQKQHRMEHASHVQYWTANWRGTLVEDVVQESIDKKIGEALLLQSDGGGNLGGCGPEARRLLAQSFLTRHEQSI